MEKTLARGMADVRAANVRVDDNQGIGHHNRHHKCSLD